MEKKVWWSLIILISVIALIITGCPPKPAPPPAPVPVAPEVFEWRATSTWTPAIALIEGDYYFIDIVRKISGGRLDITHFPAGAIIPAFEAFDAVSKGTVEMGFDWPGYWAGKNTAFDLLGSFTMWFTPVDYFIWIYRGGGLELVQELFAKYNIHYLPMAMTPMEAGFYTNKPIWKLEDMKGLKLRTPHRCTMYILEKAGASPVKIPGGEIYVALERGVIDGAEFCTPAIDFPMGFHEIAKYLLFLGWHQPASLLGVMINMDAWKKLPTDLKVILEEAAKATMLWTFAKWSLDDVEAMAKYEKVGLVLTRLPPEDLAKIEKWAFEFMEKEAAENPDHAKIARSQVKYMKEYSKYRDLCHPFGLGRSPKIFPDIK